MKVERLENEKVQEISSFNLTKCKGSASCLCLHGWAEEQAFILVQNAPQLIHFQT